MLIHQDRLDRALEEARDICNGLSDRLIGRSGLALLAIAALAIVLAFAGQHEIEIVPRGMQQ